MQITPSRFSAQPRLNAPSAVSINPLQSRDQVHFGQAQTRRQVAQTALEKIDEILAADRPLSVLDLPWLNALTSTLGGNAVQVPDPSNPDVKIPMPGRVSIGALSQNYPAALENLRDTLKAMLVATDYRPTKKSFGRYELSIHNRALANRLKPEYTPRTFQALMKTCLDKGVFDVVVNPEDGVVETAGIEQSEDDIMNQRWVTDSVRNGDIEKPMHPDGWRKVLDTLARFYENEAPAFEQVITEPQSYRDDPNAGVHHIFDPQELKRYAWLAPKRLESHGLALKAFCETIVDGKVSGKPWGFTDVPERVTNAIASLAKYFEAINYADAPSNGAWEELAFEGGLTSDVAMMHDGLVALRDLMFNPAYDGNANIAEVRSRLKNHQYGDLLTNQPRLDALIQQGEQKVRERLNHRRPAEHPTRAADAGLPFVVSSGVKLDDHPYYNFQKHMRVLASLEKEIVRDNGLVRYNAFPVKLANGNETTTFDGYLTPNWGLSAESDGKLSLYKQAFARQMNMPITHIEPSTAEGFVARSRLAGEPGTEAEWFMIAEMARAYGEQLSRFLDSLNGRRPNWIEGKAISEALRKQTEYMNRSFARITGEGLTKANGKPCPAWKVPEAYQHVSRLTSDASEPKTAIMPGVNTPLAWAASSLYGAARNFQSNLKRTQNLCL